MIKKVFLCFCMLLLPISLLALENASKDVIVGNVEGSDDVISINVDWDDLRFIYYYETDYIWNSSTHTYDVSTKEYWSNKNNIKITNASSKNISVIPKYTGSLSGINGVFSDNRLNINSNTNKTITFGMSGVLDKKYTSYTKAGVITLQFE